MARPATSASNLPGVNVVGYHSASSGLGHIARSITASLEASGVPVAAIDVAETMSPAANAGALGSSTRSTAAPYPVTIAVITAMQLPAVAELYPEPFDRHKLRIGYWFWELSIVPANQAPAFAFIDRVWAPSRFVADAYKSSGPTPVELQPPYMPEPKPSALTRAELGLSDQFTFLTSFDYLSVVERKNPLGVITAFREAFLHREDMRLLIKTINADRKPASARLVRDAASGDARITLLDQHLPDGDQAALVAHADCLVSLHRSEGLGLHLAEAMWLQTPVIATAYSGNIDFMDDDVAAMVNSLLTPILNGEDAYPEGEYWGQPDVLEAADWMRRLAADASLGAQFAGRARQRMLDQPSPAEVGARMSESLAASLADHHGVRRGGMASRVLGGARRATAPVRGYVNTHFEMTKHEVRLQTAAIADRQNLTLERLADSIESIANTVGEVHVHQTRATNEVRDELADLRLDIAELRHDMNRLAELLAKLAESDQPIR